MVEFSAHSPGTFCFIESGSVDIDSSHRFYVGLFRWGVDERLLPSGESYTRFLMRDKPVAGMYGVGADHDFKAIPPQWLSYVSVEDAAATLENAIGLGATSFGDVVGVPGVVTVAEFTDPAGAVCGLWQPGTHIGANYVGEPGALTWNELVTPEPVSAASFYCDLFGWTVETLELHSGTYHLFGNGSTLKAGMKTSSSAVDDVSPSWRAHVGVSDLDEATTSIVELGGSIEEEANRIPGLGRRAAVRDPLGISFLVVETTLRT